ncbi:general transcription factor II-I repeat domain-containing protein 2-like [Diretmus argenteus]
MKEYNINRHYNGAHKDTFEKYTGAARLAVIEDLKRKLYKQQSLFIKATTTQKCSLDASYQVALELAKAKKPLCDGETVKKCAALMAKAFGDDKMAKNFESVSLSRRTMTRRIFDINDHVEGKVKQLIKDCSYYSLALDESTDITDVSQLLIYVRTINSAFDSHEELMKLIPLHGTTKGADVFNAVRDVTEFGGFQNLSAIATDGAPSMQGRHLGFAGLLRQSGVCCPVLHCIIHQEALCGKKLNFSHVMDVVTGVTNLIRGGNRALTHRKFVAFLDEVDAAYGDLKLHAEVRWMSRGKCLERFFALRTEIPLFLEEAMGENVTDYCDKLRDVSFLSDLAFLTDITQHLNGLNLMLQGRDQTVADLFGHVSGFRRKLNLFKDHLLANNLSHFHACTQLRTDLSGSECPGSFTRYANDIATLQEQFNKRFQDFHSMQPRIDLFTAPLSAVIDEQPINLQMELCELQADPFYSKQKERGVGFWKLLPESRFPQLRDFALSLASSQFMKACPFAVLNLVSERSLLEKNPLVHRK